MKIDRRTSELWASWENVKWLWRRRFDDESFAIWVSRMFKTCLFTASANSYQQLRLYKGYLLPVCLSACLSGWRDGRWTDDDGVFLTKRPSILSCPVLWTRNHWQTSEGERERSGGDGWRLKWLDKLDCSGSTFSSSSRLIWKAIFHVFAHILAPGYEMPGLVAASFQWASQPHALKNIINQYHYSKLMQLEIIRSICIHHQHHLLPAQHIHVRARQ